MNIESAKQELEKAMHKKCLRATFGSIIRRNCDEIERMSTEEKRHLIKELGMAESYYVEVQKEISVVRYDRGVDDMQSVPRKFWSSFPRAALTHTPTPLHKLPRLSAEFAPRVLYVKRDDCTGLAMGGNKARQLEFYLGEAIARGCDTVLSTGAVQSNYMRMLAAGAAKLGLACHIQLESRVDNHSDDYQHSGNVLLDRLFGAQVHRYPTGEDEHGADAALCVLADELADEGKKPYIIPLAAGHAPIGALGYVVAAAELVRQTEQDNLPIDLIAVGSGSGLTHAGLLTGLKLMATTIPVLGVCVRRKVELQRARVFAHCEKLADMLGHAGAVDADDVWVDDSALAPGYGYASKQVIHDMRKLATHEGLLTDPVYSAKTFSCVLDLLRNHALDRFRHIAIIHTGGTPGLFAYRKTFS